MRIVGVVIRHRDHRDNFAGANVEDDAGGGDRAEFGAGGEQFIAQRVLHAQIDGEIDRILQAVGGEAGHMQRGETVPVEPLFHAGDALVVDIDVADHMRDFGTVRIIALVLVEKADAGQALLVDRALLFRRDVALEPDKAALRRKPLAEFRRVEIGQIGSEEFDRFVDVDQPARLGIERGHAHVGSQNFAVAIENVRTRRRDGVAAADAMHRPAVRRDAEHDEPQRDDGIDRSEGDDRQPDAGARLGAAIDPVAVEHVAHEPPPPGLRRAPPRAARSMSAKLPRRWRSSVFPPRFG